VNIPVNQGIPKRKNCSIGQLRNSTNTLKSSKTIGICIFNMLRTRKITRVVLTISSHNLPTDIARELFKPSEEGESFRA